KAYPKSVPLYALMTTDRINWQHLWNVVYAVQGHPNITSDDYESLNRIVRSISESREVGVDGHLLRGYILYHFGEVIGEGHSCESDLLWVVATDPDNDTAWAYLGHFYFDNREWVRAGECLSKVSFDRYRVAGQHWRVLKFRELIVCCELMLGKFSEAVLKIG